MTFAAQEESRHYGEPVSLFHFQYGEADKYYGYTDAEEDISYGGFLYKAISIQMGTVRSSGTLDKQSIEVRTAQNVELAELFRLTPPSRVVTLIVRQGHLGDADGQFLVTWTGRLLGHKRQGNEAIYTVESVATSRNRPILRAQYMYGCRHVLYGPRCQASKAAATSVHTVLSVSGANVTLASNWATSDRKPKYVNGMVEWTTLDGLREIRSIMKIKGLDSETLLLDGAPKSLMAGMSVDVILGCDHQGELENDCHAIHNNIQNYGGGLWIPTKNPIGIKNTYY